MKAANKMIPAKGIDRSELSRLDACGHELACKMEQTARQYISAYPQARHSRVLVTAAIRMLYFALRTEPGITQARQGLTRAYATILDNLENTAMGFFGRFD